MEGAQLGSLNWIHSKIHIHLVSVWKVQEGGYWGTICLKAQEASQERSHPNVRRCTYKIPLRSQSRRGGKILSAALRLWLMWIF